MINPEMQNADGTFKAGNPGGPGKPRGRMTWQDYADRVDHFLSTYARGEINALVLNEDEFDKLVVRDALIVQTIAESLSKDGLMSRKELLNRVIGEAIKRGELTGKDGANLFNDDARAAIEGKLCAAITDQSEKGVSDEPNG